MEHRFLGLDRRLIWPTLGIVLVQILLAAGLPALNNAVEAKEFAPGSVLELAKGQVTFVPADGWSAEKVPLPGTPAVTIFRGAVTLTISTGEFDGSPSELLDELVDEYDGDFKVTGDPQTFALTAGLRAAGVTITTEDKAGSVIAIISDVEGSFGTDPSGNGRHLAVTLRAESPQSMQVDEYVRDVAAMMASIRVKALEVGGES